MTDQTRSAPALTARAQTLLRSAQVMRRVQDALLTWTRQTLVQAGLDHIQVLAHAGEAPEVASGILLVPYELGPYPKLREPAQTVSLFEVSRAEQQEGGPNGVTTPVGSIRNIAVSESWIVLALAIAAAVRHLSLGPPTQGRPSISGLLFMDERLPLPLKQWFQTVSREPEATWASLLRIELDAVRGWVLPYIGWQSGMVLQVNYILLPYFQGSNRLSPPQADQLPALAALAASMFSERMLPVNMPAWPVPPALEGFLQALKASLPEGPLRDQLEQAHQGILRDEQIELPFSPVQDLTDQSSALLLQALRLPLQPALNLRLQVRLADGPELAAGAVAQSGRMGQRPPPPPSEPPFGASSESPYSQQEGQGLTAQLEELRQHPLFADMPIPES